MKGTTLLLLALTRIDAFNLPPSPQKNDSNMFKAFSKAKFGLPNNVKALFPEPVELLKTGKKAIASLAVIVPALILAEVALNPLPAFANEARRIAEIKGSGLVFKDTLTIESFDDPKVKGVTLYISNFERPINERMTKNFFNDPLFAAVGCAKTGKISVADNIAIGKSGVEVFEEKRSLLFKQLRVQRIYDKEKNTVVYVSFNTRLNKNDDDNKSRFKTAICAVNLDDPTPSVQEQLPPKQD